MDGFLHGWWTATTFQQDCDVSKGWWFGLEYWEVRWKVPLGSLEGIKMTFARCVEFITGHFQLWFKKQDSAFWNTMHYALSHAAKKHHSNKTVWKCISTPTVNVSLCEVWLVVAKMHLYAQLPACMESFLRLQRHQQLQIHVCCSTLAFFYSCPFNTINFFDRNFL